MDIGKEQSVPIPRTKCTSFSHKIFRKFARTVPYLRTKNGVSY